MGSLRGFFIGGRWVEASGTGWLDVVSPSTEETIGRVPEATPADIDRAVVAARHAFDHGPWPRLSVEERVGHLRRFLDAYDELAQEAVETQIDEMGGTRRFLAPLSTGLRSFAERTMADALAIKFSEEREGVAGKVLVFREPIGVVAGIVPWNAPVHMAVGKLMPSLLTGCPMVLKPAPESPLSAYVLSRAFEAADLPEGVVSIVPGGRGVGEYLVGHAGVDKVTFTGSTQAGAQIAATCGAQIKPVTLELGGKSAAIILEDAELDIHLPALIGKSLQNTGQMCIATTRLLVQRNQHADFVARLVDYVANMRLGDPHDPDSELGPLVAKRQRDRVESFIKSGIDEGATVAYGGGRPTDLHRGWYVEPTVFDQVDNTMTIAREEIFGPVVAVLPYDNEDEAIAIANDSSYGLGGAVFTADLEHGIEVARRIRTGTFSVNDGPFGGGGGPFGGYKRSGLGRERGPEGLESFLQLKSVALPPARIPS
jgi:aldehyde dehydrogenase (NAD+)